MISKTRILKLLYFSKLGRVISFFLRSFAIIHRPFMVYGFYNQIEKKFKQNTRISSNAVLINKKKLNIGNNVWIGHFSLIDSSNMVTIGNGVQTGSHISVYSHSSHNSIRFLGEKYIDTDDRFGYIKGEVCIGEYSFIGTGSVIMPNVSIGKGCLIKSGSLVNISVPDFSLVEGNPAKIVGSTLDFDKKFFKSKIVRENYFDRDAINKYLSQNKMSSEL